MGAQLEQPIDLIIDTDPGADDVIALLFALASPQELNVLALTTVAGNVRLDKTSRNARLALEWGGCEEVPVHDATVIAYLLKPALFSGRSVNVVVDSREGPTFGQTIVDWYDCLKAPKNALWVESGDAQGFFDLLTERLARLQ